MSYITQKIIKNSIFLKVQEGTPHTIRLLDESPTEQFQHKVGDKLTACAGDMCSYCSEGVQRQQRFVVNAYDHTDEKVVLWSYGGGIGETLKSIAIGLAKDEEDILNHDLEVSAKGQGLQKKTSIQLRIKSLPVPEGIKKHRIGPDDKVPF